MRRTCIYILLACFTFLACSGLSGEEQKSVDGVKVRLGIPRDPLSALALIAQKRGLFAIEGVQVDAETKYPSGKRALAAMIRGELDVILAAEVPVVLENKRHEDLRIIAELGSSEVEAYVVARMDQGIVTTADLKGKRLATQKASAVHYFLSLFLTRHGLSERDIQLSFSRAEELPRSLFLGEIDAFSMREPFVTEAKHLLPDKLRIFDSSGMYRRSVVLVTRSSFIEKHSRELEKIIAALISAERFAVKNEVEAQAIVAESLDLSREDLEKLWRLMRLEITLEKTLVTQIENIMKWGQRSELIEAGNTRLPADFIAPTPLSSVDLTRVSPIF